MERTYNHEDYVYKYQFREELNDWLRSKGFNTYSETKVGKEMKELGFEDTKKESPGKDKRYYVWVGLRWRNTQGDGSVRDVQGVQVLYNNSHKNIENCCKLGRQPRQPGQSPPDGKVAFCDLDIPPRGNCRSHGMKVSPKTGELHAFCMKHNKWCYHADLGEANDE